MDRFEKEAQRLRKDVLRVYGKPVEYNTDCDGLAADMTSRTQRRISSSTLKRIFGFVKRTSNFSKHTFDTMSRYVGFESWLDYMNVGKQTIETPYSNELWNTISVGAVNITGHNLKTVKDCAGIAFEKAVSRQFAQERMREFLASDKLAMAFVAPGGYGKSVMSAKLVEDIFLNGDKESIYKNDIVWFLDGGLISGMLSKDQKIKSWVYEQMGYNSDRDLLSVLHNNPQYRLGRLVVFIDGFNEVNVPADKLDELIDNLLRALSVIVGINWFKIVVTCRPNTWLQIVDKVSDNRSLQNAWFKTSFSEDFHEVINVPPLNEEEINTVLTNCNEDLSLDYVKLHNTHLADLIKHPLFLQLYLQKANPIGQSEVDLFIKYVSEIIMKGPLGSQKLELVNEVLKNIEYGINGNTISKEKISSLAQRYEMAFRHLLSYGIFHEYKGIDKYLTFINEVKFTSKDILEFLIATLWLRENKLSLEIFDKVETFYKDAPEIQTNIMKWMLRYAFQEKNMDILKEIPSFVGKRIEATEGSHLSPQTNPYYVFIEMLGVELRKNEELSKKLLPLLASNEYGRKYYFELFYDLDYSNLGTGKDFIDYYISNSNKAEDLMLGHSLKFMKYFLSNDEKKLQKEYNILKEVSKDETPAYQLGLSYASQIIYDHFIENGSNKQLEKNVFQIGTDLSKSPSAETDFPYFQYFTMEAYNLCGKHYEALKMYKKIKNPYLSLEKYNEHPFYKMLNVYQAHTVLNMKEDPRLVEQAQETFEEIDEETITSLPLDMRYYWTLRYSLIKADFLEYNGNTEEKLDVLNKAISLSTTLKFDFFKQLFKKIKREGKTEEVVSVETEN